jgi:acylphosphatase
MPTVSKRVRYAGRVQGVGFRATARAAATGRPIAGYVRNLPTGEVELVAEGEAADVEAFLAAVAERMRGYVTHTLVEDVPPQSCTGFRIRP